MKRFWISIMAAACLTAASADQVCAQAYPSRPIRFIVPYAPGGSADTVTRLVGRQLTSLLGEPVVVDNRPGANGHIGMQIAANATPDGYTLVLGYITNITIDQSLYRKLPYDPVRDFTPITQLDSTPNLLVVYPGVPAKTMQQFIAYAKANPEKVNFGSSGIGSIGDLTGELLNRLAGIHMLHVPYNGSGRAVIDLLSGQIQMMFSGFSSTLPHVKAGQLRALAITSAQRSPVLPDLPTLSESGFPGVVATAWHGMFAPAGTPPAVVNKLYMATTRALATPVVKERLSHLGFQIGGSSPQEFAAFIQSEIKKWALAVKTAGVKID